MESKTCSLLGDHCGRRSLLESLEMVYLLSLEIFQETGLPESN